MPKFTTKLGSTYYIKKGRLGDKFPLISCHGGPGGTHHSVKPILELSKERQVVVYDQIGSGLSSATPKSKWNIEVFCKNLNELINHLGYKKVILHGSSWGGTLILEYYKRYPSKVAGLIFHSSLISEKHWRDDAQKLISKLPAKVQKTINACQEVGATDSKVYQDAMMVYYKKHLCRDKKIWETKTKTNFNAQLYNYMWGPSEFCATGTLKKYNGLPALKKIKIPALFVSGEFDEATPASSKYFASLVKFGNFKMIKKASHSSLREKKNETLKVFNLFLSKSSL
jgi:proline iminopeptidase